MRPVSEQIDAFILRVRCHLTNNLSLVAILITIAMANYGFELFNLNLTIDEEVHAFASQADQWVAQGRWGMYLLNSLLLPQPVIPFVPLFTALTFQFFSILLLLSSWEVKSSLEKLIIGGIGISYPGMAYMYTFSTINFGVGVGLFFVALAVFIYTKAKGANKLLAALPAAASIAIYQGFTVALAAAFLVSIISAESRSINRNVDFRRFATISLIGVSAVIIYYSVQKLFLLANATNISYVDAFFDIDYLRSNFSDVSKQIFSTLKNVYTGDPAIYGSSIRLLPVIITLSFISLVITLIFSSLSPTNKLFVVFLCALLLILPFVSGFVMRGLLAMRFLVALPVMLAGLVMLGMQGRSRKIILFFGALTTVCLFQFAVSNNALFSSSHLALQADRLLAGMLLQRIADAKAESGNKEVKYLEVVGYIDRPSTRLIPKLETFGASFFEWDQGNTSRILLFLRTLGYQDLQPLPLDRRAELMDFASDMPIWPEKGSVQISGQTAVVKFSPYSYVQKRNICEAVRNIKYCD